MMKYVISILILGLMSCAGGCGGGSGETSTSVSQSTPSAVTSPSTVNPPSANTTPSVSQSTSVAQPTAKPTKATASTKTVGPVGQGVDIEAVVKRKGGKLGQACVLVPDRVVAQALGKTAQDIILTNSSNPGPDPDQTSCFYKWDDPDLSNAGVFIQLMRNPMGDEFPTYVSQMIEQKRLVGEQTTDGERTVFKKFEGFGDDGAYNSEDGKYFWRLGEEIVFQIAFNTSHTPEEKYQIATDLARSVTESYLK